MATSRAKNNEQVRLCRQRQRDGKVRLVVWADECALLEVLRIAGFIREDERDPEGPELERLLEHVIELWVAPYSIE